MRNSFGQAVTVTLFGESHGAAVGAVLDGMAPGLAVDETFLAGRMALRPRRGRKRIGSACSAASIAAIRPARRSPF